MRLIDADAIEYESIDSCDTGRYERYYGTGIIAVRKEDIDEMPTIEPEPKKGEWLNRRIVYMDAHIATCDQCGKQVVVGNFCSHCGADMREGGEE